MTSPRCNLLYQEDPQEDEYFNSKPSYYKRGNLLATCSFRQKYKVLRTGSLSYASLDENKQEQNSSSLDQKPMTAVPFFSRNKKMMAERSNSGSAFHKQPAQDVFAADEDHDEDSDENAFFAKNKRAYSRQNLAKTSSWKSSVLKAVGVKSR